MTVVNAVKRKAEPSGTHARLVKQRTSADTTIYRLVYDGPALKSLPSTYVDSLAGTRAADRFHEESDRTRIKEIKKFLASLSTAKKRYRQPLQHMMTAYEHEWLEHHPTTDQGYKTQPKIPFPCIYPWADRTAPSLEMIFSIASSQPTSLLGAGPVKSDFMPYLLILASDVPEKYKKATAEDHLLIDHTPVIHSARRDHAGSAVPYLTRRFKAGYHLAPDRPEQCSSITFAYHDTMIENGYQDVGFWRLVRLRAKLDDSGALQGTIYIYDSPFTYDGVDGFVRERIEAELQLVASMASYDDWQHVKWTISWITTFEGYSPADSGYFTADVMNRLLWYGLERIHPFNLGDGDMLDAEELRWEAFRCLHSLICQHRPALEPPKPKGD